MRRFLCFWVSVICCLLLIKTFRCSEWSEWSEVTYCSLRNPINSNSCDSFRMHPKSGIKCIEAVDRIRCLKEIVAGRADFGVFKAEDLYLASLISNASVQELVVTNEFRLFKNQKFEFDMVSLVTNDAHITSLTDLKGKRLCHPGFDESGWLLDFSEIFLQYFEETIVPQQCDPRLSVLENKIKSLDSFFGSSCKPGSWSPEVSVDNKLKSRYSKLCQQCGDPNSCSSRDIYWGQQGALTCISDCAGDVTWVRKQDLSNQFNRPGSNPVCHNVSFLCPDGTIQPINSTNPCVWISRPWPVIIARKSTAANVRALINHINSSNNTYYLDTWEYSIRSLLGYSYQEIPFVEPVTPWQYLEDVPGFLTANTIGTCRGTGQDKIINICTENEQTRKKCDLMALVALVYSVDPQFNCSLAENCLKSVSEKKTDVFITNTERLKYVYENHKLKTILYQTANDYGELRYSSAVVNGHSDIHQLTDLRGKKACFTRMYGLGWNSLLMVLKEKSLINDYCNSTEEILKFFSDVCIIDHQEEDTIRGCFENSDLSEPHNSLDAIEAQGLRCIVEGGGDVTFIDHNYIGQYLTEYKNEDWARDLTRENFSSVCPYENVTSYDCYLSRATFGEVLIHEKTSKDREEEIVSAMLIVGSLLGDNKKYQGASQMFKLFTHYHNETDVLFESSASRLESAEQYLKRGRLVNDFYENDLLNMVRKCTSQKKSESNNSMLISCPAILLYFILLIHYMQPYIFVFQ